MNAINNSSTGTEETEEVIYIDNSDEFPSKHNPEFLIKARRKWEDNTYIEKLFDAKDEKWNKISKFVDVVARAMDLTKKWGHENMRITYFKLTGDSNIPDDAETNVKDGERYDVFQHLFTKWPADALQYALGRIDELKWKKAKEGDVLRYMGFVDFMRVYKLIITKDNIVSNTQDTLSQTLTKEDASSAIAA